MAKWAESPLLGVDRPYLLDNLATDDAWVAMSASSAVRSMARRPCRSCSGQFHLKTRPTSISSLHRSRDRFCGRDRRSVLKPANCIADLPNFSLSDVTLDPTPGLDYPASQRVFELALLCAFVVARNVSCLSRPENGA